MTALACIQLQSALRPDQVALGLPASTQAAARVRQPVADRQRAGLLAAGTNCGSFVPPARWPTIRGAMTCRSTGTPATVYSFANTVHGHLVTMP